MLPNALQSEKLRTQKQLTEKLRLENEITRGEVIKKSELMRTFAVIADAMVTRINSATELPRNVREDLLRDLATWPDAIEEAAHATARRTKATTKKEREETEH